MTDVLNIQNLTVSFPQQSKNTFKVLNGLSLRIPQGQTMGLVGESGSGKSMTALSILGLTPFSAVVEGSIKFQEKELLGKSESDYQKIRGSEIAIVFQDPSSSLNPVFNIEQQLTETVLQHRNVSPLEAKKISIEALKEVNISNPEKRLKDFPHQLSGGMKQRVLIAMALLCEPSLLILDEPTTALDVTVQAQLLDLIESIQHFKNLSVLLISHDLGVISEISDEVCVIYLGHIVESASVGELLEKPIHPYTIGLLNSIPKLEEFEKSLKTIPGFPPNPVNRPSGCPFHPRCFKATEKCQFQNPPFIYSKRMVMPAGIRRTYDSFPSGP